MARKDKLLREWVRHGYLPPEAVGSGRPPSRTGGRAPRRRAPADDPEVPAEDPLMEVHAEDLPGNGHRPHTRPIRRLVRRRSSGALMIVLVVVVVVWLGVIGVVAYLQHNA